MLRNIYDLKLFTTFYHHATSIRLHIRRYQIKMPNKVPFVCPIGVETQTKLTDLSYTCVMVFFITVFIRNYIFIKYPSTLLFLELQSWHNLINIFSKQDSNTSVLEKNFAHKEPAMCDKYWLKMNIIWILLHTNQSQEYFPVYVCGGHFPSLGLAVAFSLARKLRNWQCSWDNYQWMMTVVLNFFHYISQLYFFSILKF